MPFPVTSRRRLIEASALGFTSLPGTRFGLAQDASPTPEPPEYQTIAVDDLNVAYRVQGSGEPLPLIQGFGGTMDQWDSQFITALGVSYQVIVFDNRGVGRTTVTGRYRFPQLADDAAGLLTSFGIETAHVFGWSMGAMIALDMTLRRPERVRTATLHAGTMGGPNSIPVSEQARDILLDTGSEARSSEDRLARLLFPEPWIEAHPERVDEILARQGPPAPPRVGLEQGLALVEWDDRAAPLADVTRRTLIIQGQDDIVIPAGNADLLADGIPDVWLIKVPGGHGLHYQIPQAMAAMVSAFITDGAED